MFFGVGLAFFALMFGITLLLVIYWVIKFVVSLWTGA